METSSRSKCLTLQILPVIVTHRVVVNQQDDKVANVIIGIAMIEITRKNGMIDIADDDDVILHELTMMMIVMMFERD